MTRINGLRNARDLHVAGTLIAAELVLLPLLYVFRAGIYGPTLPLAAYGRFWLVVALGNSGGDACHRRLVAAEFLLLRLHRHEASRPSARATQKLSDDASTAAMVDSVLIKAFAFTIILGRIGTINFVLNWLIDSNRQKPNRTPL